ncbi:hypothetical protein JAAARDRAFT_432504 [Jaapia argillacea MUCL 33604]|uniref:PX domain-containing protein n=1 Tax=Jaapia argillacea MUCL 33604 TaxID=933084 RepID=A0A067PET4_9AGAM|nr:hypothetical protein JAAARDRAFT_432504 [Jaapia argillacea MUCL 33604]
MTNIVPPAHQSLHGHETPIPPCLPPGILLTAEVPSFHHENEEYHFRINAIYQPFDRSNPVSLPPAKQLTLLRVYEDFYQFQINLLSALPRESGREPPHPRIIPYTPGPFGGHVDRAVTAQRRSELDTYLYGLCSLLKTSSWYILEHGLVAEFLSLRPGDVEGDIDPRVEEMRVLGQQEDRLVDPGTET